MAAELSDLHFPKIDSFSSAFQPVNSIFKRLTQTVHLPSDLTGNRTFYDGDGFRYTKLIALGDSFCNGYIRHDGQGKKICCPPSEYLVRAINNALGVHWKSILVAQDGATAQAVRQQMQLNANAFFDHSVSGIDVYLSILGNNALAAVKSEFSPEEIESLFHSRISPNQTRRFFGCVRDGIKQHERGIQQILGDLAIIYRNGGRINRLFVQGVPNIGNASVIEMVCGENNIGPASSIRLKNKVFPKAVFSVLSRMMDLNNRRVVSGCKLPFEVLYVDAFHELSEKDFEADHPNELGYKRVALKIMNLQWARFSGQLSSFRKEYEKSMPQNALAA